MADLKAGVTTSFNGGEIAPYLAGRVDHEGFSKCVRKLVNGIPEIGGGIKKFYGTEFVHALPIERGILDDLGMSRPISERFALIPFHHEDEKFLLVLHDGKLDAIVDDHFVQLGIRLPTISDYQKIRYEQANDVLICCCEECEPFRIEYLGFNRSAEAAFALKIIEFDEVPYFPLGYTGNYSGVIEIEGEEETVIARIPDALRTISVKVSYPAMLPVGTFSVSGKVYRGYKTENSYTSTTDPTMGDITVSLVKRIGDNDTVVKSRVFNSISKGNVYMYEQDDRIEGLNKYLYWTSNNFSFSSFSNAIASLFPGSFSSQPDVYIPVSSIEGYEPDATYYVSVSWGASKSNRTTNNDTTYRVDYNKAVRVIKKWGLVLESPANAEAVSFGEVVEGNALYSDVNNLVGRKLKIYQNSSASPVKAWYQGMTVEAGKTIAWSDGRYYLAKYGTETKSAQPVHTEGIVSDGGVEWQYLHSGYVTATISRVMNDHEMELVLKPGERLPVSNLNKDSVDVIKNSFSMYRWSIWGTDAIFPSEVFFNSGRLGFFINTRFGTYYSLSRSDSYYDFSEDSDGEVLDTDSIQGLVTGGSYSNKINWVISRENIYCGSYSTEFVIRGMDGLMTPSTTVCKPVSFTGGDKVAALKYMTLSLFVGSGGDNLNVVNYDYSSETYQPIDVSYIAGHLFEGRISKLVSVPRPDNCVYTVGRDGSFMQLVDSVAEKVQAFSRLDVGGKVVDAASVFCKNDTDVYLARVVGDEYHIEKFSIADPTYMLSARRYKSATGSIVEPAFANKEVYVKSVSGDQFYKVSVGRDGVIINDFVGEDIVVGKPMPFEVHGVPSVGRKLEGSQQKSVRFLVRLLDSGAFSYGSSHDFNKWYEYNNWNVTGGQAWDSSHKLMTGDIQLPASFGYMQGQNTADGPYPNDTSVALNVFSDTPEPFNLLMVSSIYV